MRNKDFTVVTEDGTAHSSDDGINWTPANWEGNSNIRTLIAGFTDVLTVVTSNGEVTQLTIKATR